MPLKPEEAAPASAPPRASAIPVAGGDGVDDTDDPAHPWPICLENEDDQDKSGQCFECDQHFDAGASGSAFPNDGVSQGFLHRIRDDGRLCRPVIELPIVGGNGELTTPPSLAAVAAFGDPELRSLCKDYRVFSYLDGETEFGQYDGTIPVTREALLAALRQPPTTTTQVNLCVVKPDTLVVGCSYARMLVARGEGEGAVGRPTLFLSHAWRYRFADLVDALDEHLAGLPAADRDAARVWNDIFVENQNSANVKPEGYFFTAFKDAVAQIGHTVLVLTPWDDPIPITRAWCLWEIYSTLVSGATFTAVLPQAERRRLREAVLTDSKALTDVMTSVKAERAEAFEPADRDAIFAAVGQMEGGFHCVNVRVLEMLRGWVLWTLQDLCRPDSVGSGSGGLTYGWTNDQLQLARLFDNVGTILFLNGRHDDALVEYQKALAIREATLGKDHPDTADSYNFIGNMLQNQGDSTGALVEHRKAIAIKEATLGKAHPSTAGSYNNIGVLLCERHLRLSVGRVPKLPRHLGGDTGQRPPRHN